MAASCPACGGDLAAWITVPAGEPSDPRRFGLSRCADCGTAVTAGPPPGPEAYEQGVYAAGSARPGAVRAFQRATVGQPARALVRAGLRPGARVLDAGAGRGRLVHELRRRGFDATGIDVSERSVAQAGPHVRLESIAAHEDDGLDAAVLWHVAEHLDDPLAALERVRGWLAPGGLVVLGVPNAASAQARAGRAGVDALGRAPPPAAPHARAGWTPCCGERAWNRCAPSTWSGSTTRRPCGWRCSRAPASARPTRSTP